jgi:hypothetical protein
MRTIFKMKSPCRAVLSENDQPRVIPIPASAMVVLVEENMKEDAIVKIRFGGKVLAMLSEVDPIVWTKNRSSLDGVAG